MKQQHNKIITTQIIYTTWLRNIYMGFRIVSLILISAGTLESAPRPVSLKRPGVLFNDSPQVPLIEFYFTPPIFLI